MSNPAELYRVALVGNPNAGKTTLFNALTGENQKVGNYSGVTVSRKSGEFRTPHGRKVELIDLPGCYSLNPESKDEEVTRDVLLGKQEGEERPDTVICVVDASALERHLNLALSVMEEGLPVVLAMNMIDVAEKQGIRLDPTLISEELGIPVVPIQADKGTGVIELKQALRFPAPQPGKTSWFDPDVLDEANQRARMEKIQELCGIAARRESDDTLTKSDKLDEFFLHPFFGWVSLIAIMLGIFYTIFSLSSYPMDLVDGAFGGLGDWVGSVLPDGDFSDLIKDGVIAGVGGTVIFLPQIVLLFFFIGLMESSGYMSRAAFLMDSVMSKVGLSGRAFLPLLSAHACAIPGIMAARTISSAKERLITILIAPWMSCSARLPVYTTIILLLTPDASALTQASIMLGIYATGIITSLIAAKVLRSRLKEDEDESHFMLELPPYRAPQMKYLFRHVGDRAMAFLKRAGTVIVGVSILLWALETYPKPKEGSPAAEDSSLALEQSYLGKIGKTIEPAVAPLGYDWRTGTAVMASFAAREVFVTNLAITFQAEEDDEEAQDLLLREKMAAATWPDGRKLYTPLTLLSVLVFFIYALQCFPTTIVVAKETNSWKWGIGQLVGMSAFAYIAALAVFQIGRLFGYA